MFANVAERFPDETEQRDVLRVGELVEVALQVNLWCDSRPLRERVGQLSESFRERLIVQERRLSGNRDSPEVAVGLTP